MAFHLVSQKSRGLFSRVGIHSGPVAQWVTRPLWVMQRQYEVAAKRMGCEGAASVLECMRGVNATALVDAQFDRERPPGLDHIHISECHAHLSALTKASALMS